MEKRLYFARHGETDWNVAFRMQGHTDIPLNATGLKQAEALAVHLEEAGIRPDRIYSSPLRRAMQTAQPTAERTGLPVTPLEGLMEICYGEWEGLRYDEEIRALDPAFHTLWLSNRYLYAPKGGETGQEALYRLAPAIRRVLEDGEGTALIVMHGAILKTMLFVLRGIPFSEFRDVPTIGNGEYMELDWAEAERFVREYTVTP